MTPPENGKSLWTESRVESLLEDFFRREMPLGLREESPSRPTAGPKTRLSPRGSLSALQPGPRTPDRVNSWKGGAVVVLSSLMMLLVGLMFWDGSAPHSGPNRNTANSPEADADAATSNSKQPAEPHPLDALRHNGRGPVESRPRLPQVGTGDPDKPSFPELDIEVFPLDPSSEPDTPPEDRGLPESDSAPENAHPMPEENHSLPENRSSSPKDIDEDETVPLLPELRSQLPEPLGI